MLRKLYRRMRRGESIAIWSIEEGGEISGEQRVTQLMKEMKYERHTAIDILNSR